MIEEGEIARGCSGRARLQRYDLSLSWSERTGGGNIGFVLIQSNYEAFGFFVALSCAGMDSWLAGNPRVRAVLAGWLSPKMRWRRVRGVHTTFRPFHGEAWRNPTHWFGIDGRRAESARWGRPRAIRLHSWGLQA